MTREYAKTVMSNLIDVFRKEYPNGGAFAAIQATGGHSLINKIYDSHEAEIQRLTKLTKAQDDTIQEQEKLIESYKADVERYKGLADGMVQNMCATCECAKFADENIKRKQ